MFQPFIEKDGHDIVKAGKDVSGVTINVRVSWETVDGKRSQLFVYNDEMVSDFLDSYYISEGEEKYSKAFNLTLNGAEGLGEITFNAVVISDTGVEFTSAPTVVVFKSESGDDNGRVSEDITLKTEQGSANVSAGTQLDGSANDLKLTVKEMDVTTSDVELEDTEDILSVDVHVDGVSADNEVPIIITLDEFAPEYMNKGNIRLYHVEDGKTVEMTRVYSLEEVDVHNEFYYDILTGTVTMALAKFSEVAVVSDNENAWEGNYDYSWYDAEAKELTIANADQLAAFGAIVGGMNGQTKNSFAGQSVKLLADINLGDKESENDSKVIFYPIGYYNNTGSYEKTSGGSVTSNVSSFEGTFDGNGHTVANFYQNTWEMFGDYNDGYSGTPNHYKDAMGLFGYVLNGTVKNLTVSNFSSDGEFTPTGVIAAYADGNTTFENIAITDCNPKVYNTGNGGIIGIAGDTSTANDDHITLKNITVDNSNKISALWGSYDVACGGLVGMYRGNVDGSGKATGDTISFENCHVSAIIDVYNDVCANYQYYAYRYSGMIIGSVRHNTTENGKTVPNMKGISASRCTVNYGDWNDYYYCEFEKNTMASYSEDYQFSRVPHSELKFTDSNGNGVVDADERSSVTGCKHTHTAEENHQAIYLPFHQLFTGYSWGVSSIGLEKYSGIVTDQDITEGDQEESVEKFVGIADTSYITDTVVNISDLFKAKEDVPDNIKINKEAVTVSVTPVGTDSTANGVYTANKDNWGDGTLKFSGAGAAKITITDYHFCKPTVINVTIDATQKFKTKFTGDFLYRVGNENVVKVGSLFEAIDVDKVDPDTIDVNVENKNGSATGEYTNNKSDWTQGTIQFSGTGVVSVTISEAGSIPLTLSLEVVDGYNVTAFGGDCPLKNRNSVLLNKITIATNGTFSLENATLYGNGFEFDVTPAKDGDTTNGYIGGNYAVSLKNAILDNVQIIGEVYTQYGAQAKQMYNYPTILTNGDSIIANSYVSNGASAVRAQDGNLEIINSTLEGGIFANLDIRGGTVTLDNVTTINQSNADGSSVSNDEGIVGVGIAFYECNVNAKLIVKTDADGNPLLKQYNCVSEKVTIKDATVNQLKNAMFGSSYQTLQYKDANGVKWVNTGILSATEGLGDANINDFNGYTGKEATVAGKTGYVYTPVPTAETVKTKPATYVSTQQYVVLPNVKFDHEAEQNYKAPSTDSNEHCYYNSDTKQLDISFDEGKNKVYDPNILTVTKAGQTLPYTVTINGTNYTGKTITFDKAGIYTAEYTYTDPYNFKLNGKTVESYNTEYKKTVSIQVSVVEATAKDAKFTFYGYNEISTTAATTITDVKTVTSSSGNLYIMPSATGNHVTSKTIDGITVNCPRVYVDFKNNSSDFNWLYPVFLGVKIEDYADGGTAETATTIVSPTSTSKPANLTILTTDKPSGGGGWSSGSGKSGSEGKLPEGVKKVYKGLYGWTSGAIGSDQPANSIYCQFTYKDEKGTTYYYVIEFYREAHTCPSCVTADSQVTLADGSQVKVEELTGEEELLVWNLETGKYDTAPIVFVDSDEEKEYEIVHLYFEDGTDVEVIYEHGFFDMDEKEYVYIDAGNAENYIGHTFVKQADIEKNTWNTVKLTDVKIETKKTMAYSPVTFSHLCYYVDGMLSMPGGIEGLFNIFEVDTEIMAYDKIKLEADIEKYGLFTYSDFEEMIPEEAYEAFNGKYLKVAMAKGMIDWDTIEQLAERYVPLM